VREEGPEALNYVSLIFFHEGHPPNHALDAASEAGLLCRHPRNGGFTSPVVGVGVFSKFRRFRNRLVHGIAGA
jgi:hypothetical protein